MVRCAAEARHARVNPHGSRIMVPNGRSNGLPGNLVQQCHQRMLKRCSLGTQLGLADGHAAVAPRPQTMPNAQ